MTQRIFGHWMWLAHWTQCWYNIHQSKRVKMMKIIIVITIVVVVVVVVVIIVGVS